MFDINKWETVWKHRQSFIDGTLSTIIMALLGLAIALILGVIFGLMSTSGKKPLHVISRIYVEFIQNTPLMLQALFLFYSVAFSGIKGFTALMCGIIALGIYHGAYISEVVRAGINSVHKGQSEAAYSQGFSQLQTMFLIVLPQTIKIILPPMVNQVVNLIKNTSCMFLAGGAVDLISRTNAFAVGEGTASAAGQGYIIGGVIFFVICFPLSTLASKWENRLKSRDVSADKQKEGAQ
ncbi:MAG: amino acid ABC transporter permease [Lachnospiraceae bacterium]|nr:amino acid ABC transporter permease [Ruminococcus sp.]MCM1275905.1 amino acid ABC transporter permease [Lachnospiraceae bacterium]